MNTTYEAPLSAPRAARTATRGEIWLGRSAIAGSGIFTALLILLHILRPDVDPIGTRVMAYALGPYGFLMNIAYLALGLGTLALVAGLSRTVAPIGRSQLGLTLLALFGISGVLAAILNADAPDAHGTLGSLIHTKAAVFGFAGAVFASLLLPDRWRRDTAWTAYHRSARTLGSIAMAGLVLTLFTPFFLNGITQRIILVGLLPWLMVTGWRVQRVAGDPHAATIMFAVGADQPVEAPPRGARAARIDAWFARIGLLAIGYVVTAFIALNVLRPDFNPLERFMSEYVHGPYGVLMTSSFFVCALGIVALAVGLRRSIGTAGRSRTGLVMLYLAAAGVALAGIFPTDVPGGPETPSGIIHGLAGNLFFVPIIIGTMLLPDRWYKDADWTRVARPAQLLGAFALAGLAFGILVDPLVLGLSQRLIFCGVLPWLLFVGWHLHGVATRAAQTAPLD